MDDPGCGMIEIIAGDCRDVLPLLDIEGAIVITDPPWEIESSMPYAGAGADAARQLWADVVPLLGRARAVVYYGPTSASPPRAPDLPWSGMVHGRLVPTPRYGRWVHNRVMYVWGDPPMRQHKRVFPGEITANTAEGWKRKRDCPHPSPMPLDHARKLIRIFGGDGPVVDPFCGSGTILQACAEFGIPAVGIEVDPEYAQVARGYVTEALRQQRLFGEAESHGR